MTPDPKALAVLLDAARACFGDDADVVRWVKSPDAVRELLKHKPLCHYVEAEWSTCPSCGIDDTSDLRGPENHRRDCAVAAAWRALGDPRGAEDVERAHEEALWENMRRGAAAPKRFKRVRRDDEKPPGSFYKNYKEVSAFTDGQLDAMLSASPLPCTHQARVTSSDGRQRCEHCGVFLEEPRPFRLVSRPPMVIGLRGEPVEFPRNGVLPAGFTIWPARQMGGLPYVEANAITTSRRVSDARGMEAVEDEARSEDARREMDEYDAEHGRGPLT